MMQSIYNDMRLEALPLSLGSLQWWLSSLHRQC